MIQINDLRGHYDLTPLEMWVRRIQRERQRQVHVAAGEMVGVQGRGKAGTAWEHFFSLDLVDSWQQRM